MKTGIYKITNRLNGNFYIGSCAHYRGLSERLWRHKHLLKKNKHENQHLQNAWNKHGEQAFSFDIIEYCIPEECIVREQYYLDTYHPSYNICKIAGNNFGFRHTEEAKLKVSIANKGNAYHCDGRFVFYNKNTETYVTCEKYKLCNDYGLDRSTISKICRGTEKSTKGWICLGKENKL